MKNFILHCLTVLCLGIVNPSIAQTGGSDSIISFQTMHVHFDKDIYLPGETVWFKSYLYNVNEISFAATNFYAAIYDEKGKLIQQKQYPIIAGSCNGDFEIPDTIESSRIQFRAFTKAMIAEDSNNIYQRVLNVYNSQSTTAAITAERIKNLQFFPEGGQIIAELQNYIAFKAGYPDGSPAMASGQIFEVESNKVIDTFFTDNNGFGKFILIPAPRKKYFAIWKDETGAIQKTPLPIHRYGVSFHAGVVDKELQYVLSRNKTNDSLSLLHLLAQMSNYQVYKADLVISDEMELSVGSFAIDSLPAGLMQLTLFDKDWNRLQERMLFINGTATEDQPAIKRDTVNAGPKGKNTIEISLADTMFTNLSVSIADINFYQQPGIHAITQDLLLNTQLNIEQDAAKLLPARDKDALDLITLTHPWKKYNWQKLMNKEEIKSEPGDNYIALSVSYKEKGGSLPADDAVNLIINNRGNGKQFYSLKPAGKNRFETTGLVFYDSVKIAYQVAKNKELVNYLTLSKEAGLTMPAVIKALPAKINYSLPGSVPVENNIKTFADNATKKFNDIKTIKEVVVKSKLKGNPQLARIEELDKIYTTGLFSGTVRGYQLNVLDDPTAKTNSDVASYVTYRIPGVKIVDDEFHHEKYFAFEETVGFGRKKLTPLPMFLDELPVTSVGNLDLSQVAYIKYIPGIVINSFFRSTVGAVYVYTKKGNEAGPPSNNLRSVYIKGYNSQKEFPVPGYSDKELVKQPDRRTTLYWNPNVIMDKTNNTIKIDYFNNDVSKKLLLKIEGVNAAGKLIYIEKILE